MTLAPRAALVAVVALGCDLPRPEGYLEDCAERACVNPALSCIGTSPNERNEYRNALCMLPCETEADCPRLNCVPEGMMVDGGMFDTRNDGADPICMDDFWHGWVPGVEGYCAEDCVALSE